VSDDEPGILDEIESELSDLGTGDGDGEPYDPTEEFEDTGGDAGAVTVEWPDVDPTTRDLSAEEWGIQGEGPPELWDRFTEMLNSGRIGEQPAEIAPARPEQAEGWGETPMPMARSAQKPRGKHLFAHVAASPETVFRVQGQAGANDYGGTAEDFATTLQPKVHDYAERFEAGDRPGEFHAFVTSDGDVQGPQEGRHRSAAAMLAGLEWVPLVVLWETDGTFRRPSSINSVEEGVDYVKNYPEGDA